MPLRRLQGQDCLRPISESGSLCCCRHVVNERHVEHLGGLHLAFIMHPASRAYRSIMKNGSEGNSHR